MQKTHGDSGSLFQTDGSDDQKSSVTDIIIPCTTDIGHDDDDERR